MELEREGHKFHQTFDEVLSKILTEGLDPKAEPIHKGKPNFSKIKFGSCVCVWLIDGDYTAWEKGEDKEPAKTPEQERMMIIRNSKIPDERKKIISEQMLAGITLILSPEVKTIAKGSNPYEHIVKEPILPKFITAVVVRKGGLVRDKDVPSIIDICKKFSKPVYEFDGKLVSKIDN